MTQLQQEDIRALEQTRQRLYQLSQSIGSLKTDVLRTSPMPAWDSLQRSATILAQNLKSVTSHMQTHSGLFERTVTYPSTNFPGRTQEVLLGQLLRKKLEPDAERWVEEGRAMALPAAEGGTGQGDLDDLEDTWKAANDFIGKRIALAAVTHRKDFYTEEEREIGIENINTGLKKPMKPSGDVESESDEDEDEEMEDAVVAKDNSRSPSGQGVGEKIIQGEARSLDEMVRYMATGLAPEDEVQVGGAPFRR